MIYLHSGRGWFIIGLTSLVDTFVCVFPNARRQPESRLVVWIIYYWFFPTFWCGVLVFGWALPRLLLRLRLPPPPHTQLAHTQLTHTQLVDYYWHHCFWNFVPGGQRTDCGRLALRFALRVVLPLLMCGCEISFWVLRCIEQLHAYAFLCAYVMYIIWIMDRQFSLYFHHIRCTSVMNIVSLYLPVNPRAQGEQGPVFQRERRVPTDGRTLCGCPGVCHRPGMGTCVWVETEAFGCLSGFLQWHPPVGQDV